MGFIKYCWYFFIEYWNNQHPNLSLASEQTLKGLKKSQEHQRGGEESGFGYLGPPDFTEIHHRG